MPDNYFFDARTAIEDRVYASKESASLRLSEERVVRQFYSTYSRSGLGPSSVFLCQPASCPLSI